jgi:hypothetical protein
MQSSPNLGWATTLNIAHALAQLHDMHPQLCLILTRMHAEL